ncbi:MAG TPA: hypothetical protein ENI45_01685, partial [Thermoplasmatales archaeon]|nr:hypothetical protein [Thermoplasmatales archaeon]
MKTGRILAILILMLMLASTTQTLANITSEASVVQTRTDENLNSGFTHTVFAEECTATWCPNCPNAAEALYNIYQSSDYPFYYVALINDMNPIARDRNKDYVLGIYKVYALPTVYFDGGDTNVVGSKPTVQETEAVYRNYIELEGQRTPWQPVTLSSEVSWEGDAKITVTVNVTNEDSRVYFGKLRSYVTEIESRWLDNNGNPYHFGFLDFAINKPVLIPPHKTKTFTAT